MPTVCKEADLNELKPYILPAINSELPYIFETMVEGFNLTGLQFSDDDIRLDFSLELNQKYT